MRSSLATVIVPAYEGNYTKNRSLYCSAVQEITIHHMSGKLTAQRCGELFQAVGRNGSSHYGIGFSGEIGSYVDESDIAWTNSHWVSNCRAVTIEVSNSMNQYPWAVSSASFESLIKLVADIAKRHNLGTLVPGKNLTWHKMYAATDCPGDYLLSKMNELAEKANQLNAPPSSIIDTIGCHTLTGTNRNRGTNDLILYTSDKYSKTPTNQWGFEVLIDANGVAKTPEYSGGHTIPQGCSVLSGHGTSSDWINSNIEKGTIVTIKDNKVYASAGTTHVISGINTSRGTDYLVVYNKGSKCPTNQWGFEVACDSNGIALTNPRYQGGTEIPAGGFVVSGHGAAGNWIYSNIKEGYRVVQSNGMVVVDKSQHRSLYGINTGRPTDALVLYQNWYSTGTNQWGHEVTISPDGIAVTNPEYQGNHRIPTGGVVLSGHGTSSDWVHNNIRKGTRVLCTTKYVKVIK